MRRSKEKSLPKWLVSELEMLGWIDSNPAIPGYTWRNNGVQLVITPTSQSKSYIVQRTKMSDTRTTMMTETQLLAQIEGDSNE